MVIKYAVIVLNGIQKVFKGDSCILWSVIRSYSSDYQRVLPLKNTIRLTVCCVIF